MPSLYHYQEQGIAQLLAGKHFIILGTGLGKGAIGMVWAAKRCEETGKKKVLVVTTASKAHMKPNDYELDLAKWCPSSPLLKSLSSLSVISWAKLRAWVDANWRSLDEYVVVADECLPADTKVITDKGEKELSSLVVGDRVLSYDHNTNSTEYKTVTRTIKKKTPKKMYRLLLSDGTVIISTGNHPHYTQSGYKNTEDIKIGDTLYEMHSVRKRNNTETDAKTKRDAKGKRQSLLLARVQQDSRDKIDERAMARQEGCEVRGVCAMRDLRETDRDAGDVVSKSVRVFKNKSLLLLSSLCESPLRRGASESSRNSSQKWFSANMGEMSRIARRQWKDNRGAAKALRNARKEKQRVDDGAADKDRRRGRVSKLLQGGRGERLLQNSSRMRWAQPRQSEDESKRQEKGEEIRRVRVESVKVLKLRDIKRLGLYRDPDNVYCIDVEDNHNFFANGILTHNCAAIKAGVSSQRGRAFLKLAKRNPDWAGFTATPGENWLHYYPYYVACGLVRNKTSFLAEYANVQTFKGYPEIVGWRHEDKLRAMWERISYAPDARIALSELPKETHRVIEFSKPKGYSNVLKTRQTADGEFLDTTMGLCHYLRQICFTKDKEQWVRDFLENLGERAIIFYSYIAEGDKLEEIAKKAVSGKVWRVDGRHHDIPTEETCGERDVVICQWQSGSEGLNAQFIDQWVSTTPNYSYSTSLQARGRIQRIGAQHPKFYWYLKCSDGIEKDVYDALAHKRDFSVDNWAINNNIKEDNEEN